MKPSFILAAAVLPALICLSDPAWAKNDKHGNPEKGIVWDNNKQRDTLPVAIDSDDRAIIARYLRTHYAGNCPPGLAKKHNGCLPPGQAKKYAIGRPVYGYDNLPGDLLDLLSPPHGYRYVQVDKDIVLIGEASKKVIDAVTLLSAVGN